MSDYEKLNQRAAAQKAVRRKEAYKKLCVLFVIIAAVLSVFWGLEYIGFINDLFFMILVFITIFIGSFHAGRLWEISK